MPPASKIFIIDSMLREYSICLMLFFKGFLSTCVGHSSELLTLHVGHTLNVSQNHMNLSSYFCTLVLLSSMVANLEPRSQHFIIGP
jgi:hypothetical protein